MLSVPVGMGRANRQEVGVRGGGERVCLCVSGLLQVHERRGRLLHHLARASCHIAENLTNSIVPLVSH